MQSEFIVLKYSVVSLNYIKSSITELYIYYVIGEKCKLESFVILISSKVVLLLVLKCYITVT